MSEMSEMKPVPLGALAVGARVLVRRQSEAAATGAIVEDFAVVTDSEERGHDWAPVHRWAVALDDGRLVFADTADLTVDPGAGQSGRGARPTG
ncbi:MULTISPECIES: hypothetical protein [unclassified Rhodococcus (in: high G+C Gram-positive bacteria)]|jgi:hypothetical protein|uniref:hypothetical protein n=1 Tax=unclassified Rhodococcus (in: high G+C Gram-positive bacteria) TaxID=192944 RepID=UPI00036B5205|nr:hypothetical protein [Rhodococcus sp. DK17]